MEYFLIATSVILLISTIFLFVKNIRLDSELSTHKEVSANKISDIQELLTQANSVLKQETQLKDSAISEKAILTTEIALVQQENSILKEQMNDWKSTKEEHLKAAKSSMLEASKEMSNKLLDDHKREAKATKEESENKIQQTTQELNNQFKGVFESMKSLNDRVGSTSADVEIVRRALLNPAGAGNLAEITLSNLLKNSHLIEGQDYTLQHWIAGSEQENTGGLKPDAVVYLPQNNVMVIDSKSSKFFLELGEAEDENEIKKLQSQLKTSMNQHLKDLIKRDYKKATEDQLNKDGKSTADYHATIFMFVPTETALENLRSIDPKFIENAWKNGIFPVSPVGLINSLLHAQLLISNSKQEQNTKAIITEVQAMIGSISALYTHAEGVGKGLKSSLEKYDKFSASFNRTFLSKARKLEKLGITDTKVQAIDKLQRYQVSNAISMIEVEAEQIEHSTADQQLLDKAS